MQIKKLEKYCKIQNLSHSVEEGVLQINDELYEIICSVDHPLFDEDFEFNFIIPKNGCIGWVYEFGGHWYLQKVEDKEVTLTELKYIGKAKQQIPTKSFIGIHSSNELLNGMGAYKEWIKKAKFLGVKTLGICEKHTLMGVIGFQNACKKNNIKPVFGMTVSIKKDEEIFDIKLYIKDFQGWQNALKFSEKINVQNNLYLTEDFVKENSEGLIFIIDPKTTSFNIKPSFIEYYQVDTVIFEDEDTDKNYLNNFKKYLQSDLKPVALNDAYYLEQSDYEAREKLWGIAKKFEDKTKNQFFKSNDEFAKELIMLFENGNKSWIKLFKESNINLEKIIKECNFEYDVVNRRLPKYQLTESELAEHKTKENLFMYLIKKGFKDRKLPQSDIYISRLKEELRVLKKGDVVDYFLVLYDIIQYAKKEGILVGIGRGSAGGSLVSYLLDIIQIDPLEFDLLFERFLNDGRMGTLAECEAYKINDDLVLNEGSVIKILRNQKEMIIFVESLIKGDEILNYN